jgi:hypothetical protein
MTEKRKEEIYNEATRRLNEWLKVSTFAEITVGGSLMRFDMALGLMGGYPFKKPNWMKDKKFNSYVTEKEFNSEEYDSIIEELYYKSRDNSNFRYI